MEPDPPAVRSPAGECTTRHHLRSSSLFLAGRLFALLTNFFTQVLTVRYLSKNDYGAFAYAVSIAAMATQVNLLGLHRAVGRFVPIFHERRDYNSMFGTMLLAMGSIAGLGLAIIVLTFGLQGVLTAQVVTNPLSVGLLLILIALSPLDALDSVFEGMAAALASPRAIFFRRHVLAPLIKLGSVLVVLLIQGSVHVLAASYVLGGLLGVLLYLMVIFQVLRREGLLERFRLGAARLRVREIFGYSIPLISTDVVHILRTAMAVVILEHFRGSTGVADFKAVVPLAGLNLLVLQSHKILFTPMASRLYAREDSTQLNQLFWQSAIWITVMTFPVFAVCFFLAEPVTVLLFGSRYAAAEGSEASQILAILALGNYFNASMGLNTFTLQVYGRVRFIASMNALAAAAALVLNLLLIPRHGALGAAVATTASVIIQNGLTHAGLLLRTSIRLFPAHSLKVYLNVLSVTLVLVLLSVVFRPGWVLIACLVALASLLLLVVNRHPLRLEETYPELARIPLIGGLLSRRGRP